jgi:hypothetical protein
MMLNRANQNWRITHQTVMPMLNARYQTAPQIALGAAVFVDQLYITDRDVVKVQTLYHSAGKLITPITITTPCGCQCTTTAT